MVEDPSQRGEPVNIEGYVGCFVVLDRMPSVISLPTFEDVFGARPNNISSMLDQHVRVDQLSRFKVLMKKKIYVNSLLHGSMTTLNRFVKINGRTKIITTFRDMGVNTSGRYGNV
ncbi:hypothetical protein RHMOL_Rhmol09G0079300 [Rhododendron molle]|uniref:Uncharacterized protein n=1 Tax=Rhododendron molle TaxID=49168 RepID=A0ACC0MCW8_RHOML|nr:hypothetical protein RHMOL_Rhmol09G0079300 [Rhododendron molle]